MSFFLDSCVLISVLQLEAVHRKLGFTLSEILVVSNYTSEWELDPVKDFLIISSLRQMLWAAYKSVGNIQTCLLRKQVDTHLMVWKPEGDM